MASVIVLCLIYLNTNAQQLYVGVGGGMNTSYLRNSKIGFYDKNESRKWKYYLGGSAQTYIGVVPLKGNISPVFEFQAAYLYRRFAQTNRGTILFDNPPDEVDAWTSWDKKSNDISFTFKAGLKYKGLIFLTGPVVEKFLKGAIHYQSGAAGFPTENHSYGIGNIYPDNLKLRTYWSFEIGYKMKLSKGFVMYPNIAYVLGIKPMNNIDTSAGWRSGYLNHFSLSINFEYWLTLKKKINETKK